MSREVGGVSVDKAAYRDKCNHGGYPSPSWCVTILNSIHNNITSMQDNKAATKSDGCLVF